GFTGICHGGHVLISKNQGPLPQTGSIRRKKKRPGQTLPGPETSITLYALLGHSILDERCNRGQYTTADKARYALSDERGCVDAGARSGQKPGQSRNETGKPCAANAANGTGNGIARGAETQILRRGGKTVTAD